MQSNNKSNDKKIAIAVCSGASNTGQISNAVAQSLCKKSDKYIMVCLAGLTQNHEISLNKIADAEKVIVVDGCPFKCASKIINKYTNKKSDLEIQVLEDYKVKKVSDPNAYSHDIVEKISDDIISKVKNIEEEK